MTSLSKGKSATGCEYLVFIASRASGTKAKVTEMNKPLSAPPIIGTKLSRFSACGNLEGMTGILLVVRAWLFFRQSCVVFVCLILGLAEPSIALVSGSSSI
jgi:hypothetical protein